MRIAVWFAAWTFWGRSADVNMPEVVYGIVSILIAASFFLAVAEDVRAAFGYQK